MQELGAPQSAAKQEEGTEPSRKLRAEESPMEGLGLALPFPALQAGPGLGLGGREGGSLVWMWAPRSCAVLTPRETDQCSTTMAPSSRCQVREMSRAEWQS